jgi:hypothetical protein
MPKLTEITRSYSRKLNIGNYETLDFFCSAKEEVPKNQAAKTSERLFQFCKKEVEKSVAEYHIEQLQKKLEKTEKPPQENPKRFISKEETAAIQIKAEELGGETDEEKIRRFNEIENLQKEQAEAENL